jgi:hypothetical protein
VCNATQFASDRTSYVTSVTPATVTVRSCSPVSHLLGVTRVTMMSCGRNAGDSAGYVVIRSQASNRTRTFPVCDFTKNYARAEERRKTD